MSLMTWTKQGFGTDVGFADAEHQTIFNMVNGLYDKVLAKDDAGAKAALDALIAFVAKHFKHEEDEMVANNYPQYVAHKAEHDKLVVTALDLQRKVHTGEVKISVEITHFVRDWLFHHIPKIDRAYGPCLNKQGAA